MKLCGLTPGCKFWTYNLCVDIPMYSHGHPHFFPARIHIQEVCSSQGMWARYSLAPGLSLTAALNCATRENLSGGAITPDMISSGATLKGRERNCATLPLVASSGRTHFVLIFQMYSHGQSHSSYTYTGGLQQPGDVGPIQFGARPISDGCVELCNEGKLEWGFDYAGHDLQVEPNPERKATLRACQELCDFTPGCKFWTFRLNYTDVPRCHLKTSDAGKTKCHACVSGERQRPITEGAHLLYENDQKWKF